MPPIRTDKRIARHDPIVEDDDYDDDDDEFPNPIFGGKNHPGVHIWKINPVKARRHQKRPIPFRTTLDYYGVSGYVLEEEPTIETPMEDVPAASGSRKGKERDPGGGIPVCEPLNLQQTQLNFNTTNENYKMLETLRQHLDSLYSGLGIEVTRDSSGLVTGWTSGPKTIEIFAVGPQIVQQLADAVGGLHLLATVGLIRRSPNGSIMVLPKCPGNIIESIAGPPHSNSSRGSSESAPGCGTNMGSAVPVRSPAGLATTTQNIQGYPQTVPITSTNAQWPAQVAQEYPPTEPTMGYNTFAPGGLAQNAYGYSQAGPSWAGSTAQYPPVAPGMNACYGGGLMSAGPVWPTQGFYPMQSNPWVNAGYGALQEMGPTQPIQPVQGYPTVPSYGMHAGYVAPPSMARLDPAMGPTPPIQPVQGYPMAPTPQMNAEYVAPVPMAPLDPTQGNTGWDYSGTNVGDGAQSETAPTEPQVTDASCTNEPLPIEFDWDFFENYLKTLTPKTESFL